MHSNCYLSLAAIGRNFNFPSLLRITYLCNENYLSDEEDLTEFCELITFYPE
ncbi:hypothetical protein NC652_024376 [Populus alba x Populus x berolinensis]|nr:hypothetical protein NC652_024376 [Populus alba x Populus x berolinensis]